MSVSCLHACRSALTEIATPPAYVHVVHEQASFGQGTGPVWFGRVDCKGTEATLYDCAHTDGTSGCRYMAGAGVVCLGEAYGCPLTLIHDAERKGSACTYIQRTRSRLLDMVKPSLATRQRRPQRACTASCGPSDDAPTVPKAAAVAAAATPRHVQRCVPYLYVCTEAACIAGWATPCMPA